MKLTDFIIDTCIYILTGFLWLTILFAGIGFITGLIWLFFVVPFEYIGLKYIIYAIGSLLLMYSIGRISSYKEDINPPK